MWFYVCACAPISNHCAGRRKRSVAISITARAMMGGTCAPLLRELHLCAEIQHAIQRNPGDASTATPRVAILLGNGSWSTAAGTFSAFVGARQSPCGTVTSQQES